VRGLHLHGTWILGHHAADLETTFFFVKNVQNLP
jgi:hypothetical protein